MMTQSCQICTTWKYHQQLKLLGHAHDLLNHRLQLGEVKTLLFYLHPNELFDILIEDCMRDLEHIIHHYNHHHITKLFQTLQH
jgi:hypothetical protein